MAKIYKQIKIVNVTEGSGGGGGAVVYEGTFDVVDWTFNVDQYEIQIAQSTHNLGPDVLIQVEELVLGNYVQTEVYTENNNGNIKITVGNDSRFQGRVLLIG